MADGMDPTLDQTAFAILKTGLAPAGIIGNLAASVVWAVGTWIGKPLLDKIPDFAVLFASAGRSNNHDLLRALRRAECQTVVALCDLTLRDQFSVSRDSFTDRLRSWLANRPTSEFRALCHIRRVFSHTYAALEKMPVQQLIEVHGAAVSNVNVLITAGNECVAAMNRNQLREQVVSQQVALLDDMVRAILAQAGVKDQALLSLALSTREQIPSGLRQRIEQHPQGWWELFPLAFREELKDNQRARVAWEMDVLSQLQQQWGDTSTAFEQQMSALDSTLTGIWDDLTRLRHVIDDAIPNMLGLLEGIDDTTRRTEEKVDTLLGQGKRHDPPPLQLPRPAFAGTLFGRAELLAELVARLERREHVDIWGLAGMGKTALAAEAIRAVVGDQRDQLVHTPYPDGVVLLDLYQRKFTSPDPIWHHLADAFDKSLSTALPARERASKACQGRQALVIVEGAEEAKDGSSLQKLLAVLAPETIRLVLTRSKKLISTANPIDVDVALAHDEALALLRTLCPNV